MKFIHSINNRVVAIVALFLLGSIGGYTQSTFSTYSRFGIGIPTQPGSMTHFGMGGLSTPITDGTLINFSNPASYSFNGLTSLQVNAIGSSIKASTNDASSSYNAGQANEIAMLFKKPGSKWGFAAGLSPYSMMNYKLSSSEPLNDTTTANYIYNGTGGLNKMTFGASRAFTIYKTIVRKDTLTSTKDTTLKVPVHQISIGINANYLFGSLLRENQVEFNSSSYYNTKEISKLKNRGFIIDGGALYKGRLSKQEEGGRVIGESHLYVGFNYSFGLGRLESIYTEETSRYVYTGGVAVSGGTTYVGEEIKGCMTIPNKIALGIAYRKNAKKWGRYTVGVDYKMQDWTKYALSFEGSPFSQQAYLDQAGTLSLGAEFEPSIATKTDLLHRMSYRAGLRQTDMHLNINGTAIKQQAVSLGISIPVVRSLSRLHLAAEYMTSGTHDNNLIQEKGFNFMIGFSLTPSERWFFQRKYD